MHGIPVHEDDFTAFCILYFVFSWFYVFQNALQMTNDKFYSEDIGLRPKTCIQEQIY